MSRQLVNFSIKFGFSVSTSTSFLSFLLGELDTSGHFSSFSVHVSQTFAIFATISMNKIVVIMFVSKMLIFYGSDIFFVVH